jgi:electron transfer flavoprotein beta subunit
MEILVCLKRVPDMAENEIELDASGADIRRDDLVYSLNEWDSYALEEALRLREKHGGSVSVATVDSEDGDEVLRRGLGMGADAAVHLMDDAFEGSDGKGVARILKAEVERGNYDLVLTGVQADDGAAQVGGLLAAMLEWPYASIVNSVEVSDDGSIRIGREVAGGRQEIHELDPPCVLSIQTGINEPRYVGIRGVRKAASVEIPVHGVTDLGISPDAAGSAAALVRRRDYFLPEPGEGAEMLQGSEEEILDRLVDLLKSRGRTR